MTNGNGQGLIALGYEKQRQKGISDGLEPWECLTWSHKLLVLDECLLALQLSFCMPNYKNDGMYNFLGCLSFTTWVSGYKGF